MSNPIKYTAGTETLALKKGNFFFGTGDVGKGPTNVTGYYNGVDVPKPGYVVYQYKENVPGNLTYGALNSDTELINFTNGIAGQTFTSATQCLTYYAGQTDKICFNRDYEPIITDGLILNVDAGFDGSYPASGTTWRDLSTTLNNGTLTNSPSFYDNGGGSIIFDATDEWVNLSSTYNSSLVVSAYTIEAFCKLVSAPSQNNGAGVLSIGDGSSNAGNYELLLTKVSETEAYIYSRLRTSQNNEYTYVPTSIKVNLNYWTHVVSVFDGVYMRNYVNGVEVGAGSTQASGQTLNQNISSVLIASRHIYPGISPFPGYISNVRLYNKGLTASEVLQNYNAMKDRFAFIFTVDTTKVGTTSSTQFKLPLVSSGSVNFVVEWGDGTTDTITTFNQAQTTHTYSSGGTYEIKIRGLLKGWQFDNGGDKLKMGVIKNWGCLDISVSSGFYGCTNLTASATDAPTITSTSLASYFRNCSNFNGAIGNWNTSNVTNMNSMMLLAQSFNQPIGNWDVSNVTNMGDILQSAILFNQDLSLWNVSKVTTFQYAFAASAFNNNGSSNINNWNINITSAVNMNSMFRSCPFNQPIGNWNTSAVTNMSELFISATAFNQNIGNWNVSGVTNMSSMFFSSSFNNGGSSSINNWNTSNVTNMSSMFQNCYIFNQNIGSWNVSKVTNMQNMFSSNASNQFNQNIGSWNVSKVTNMSGIFRSCVSFNQPIGNWITSGVTTMSNMFENADAFNQDISNWDINQVTSFTSFLIFTPGLSTINYDLLLVSWESQTPSSNININFGGSKYTANSAAATARQSLVNTYGWTITDGGQV